MSIYRKPADFLDPIAGADGKHRAGGMAVHCTERATERGDTWEMSMFNTARKEWARSDPVRLKQMAAMFLVVACDWEYDAVAIALGYSGRQQPPKAIKAALRAVRKMLSA